MPFIAALLGPELNDFPIPAVPGVAGQSFVMRFIETGDPDQVAQIVGMAGIRPTLVREFKPPSALGNAGLQRALHGVAGQIIGTVVHAQIQQ